jgi:hypothetical protein
MQVAPSAGSELNELMRHLRQSRLRAIGLQHRPEVEQ